MSLFLLGHIFCKRLKRIAFLYRNITSDCKRLICLFLRLIIIDIEILIRCHDDIMPKFHSSFASFCSSPGHHSCIRRKFTLKDLIPADKSASALGKKFLCLGCHITLKEVLRRMFFISCYAKFLDLVLTVRTFSPFHLRTFISSYMDIFRREHIADFCEHILYELHCGLLAYAKYILGYAPLCPYFIRTAGTSEIRIRRKSSLHVTGKVNFRNYIDTSCSGIVNNFTDLIL